MIIIIDYGMGNLKSVQNAFDHIHVPTKISNDIKEMKEADALILPGVGAFIDCMNNLINAGVIDTIKEEVAKGKPLLGICLGMQVLFERSYEGGICEGLGLLQGEIVKMEDVHVKIPHIGWNALEIQHRDEFLQDVSQSFVYYVHSYYAQGYQDAQLLAYSEYGSLKIPGVFRKGNIMATQFHPEKSGEDGLQILRNFIRINHL